MSSTATATTPGPAGKTMHVNNQMLPPSVVLAAEAEESTSLSHVVEAIQQLEDTASDASSERAVTVDLSLLMRTLRVINVHVKLRYELPVSLCYQLYSCCHS